MYTEKDKPQPPLTDRSDPVGVVLDAFIENDRKVQEVTGDHADTLKSISDTSVVAKGKSDKYKTDSEVMIKVHTNKVGAVHGETKETVGLANKDNWPMATTEQHLSGVDVNAFAHPAGLTAMVEQRLRVNPDNYIPARTIPYSSGGQLGDVPQYPIDLTIGELVQSKDDPFTHLGETPWEFSTSSGVVVFPTLNNAPIQGRYTQLPTEMPRAYVHSPLGGSKIRVYNKVLDLRRTRPSFIRGWLPKTKVTGDIVRRPQSLMDTDHVTLKQDDRVILRSFNKNSIPVDYADITGYYGGLPNGLFKYTEGKMYNFSSSVTLDQAPVSPAGNEIYIRFGYRSHGFNIGEYLSVNGPGNPTEQNGTLDTPMTSYTASILPPHNKMEFVPGTTFGSFIVRLKNLVTLPAGIEAELYNNIVKELSEKPLVEWRNKMVYHFMGRVGLGWFNKTKTKYWHAWLDFEVIDRHNTPSAGVSTARFYTNDTIWNSPKQVMDNNYDLTGTGLFKAYEPTIKQSPLHPLAMGGVFESQGGHLKTYTLYGRQYVGYYKHEYNSGVSFMLGGNKPLPAIEQAEFSVQSTLNANGMYGDHLRHIPISFDRGTGMMTYLTQIRDGKNRYAWAKASVPADSEYLQSRDFDNYKGPVIRDFKWLGTEQQEPKPFLIYNDDFQADMDVGGLVFHNGNNFIGFSSYTFDTESLDNPVVYGTPVTLDTDVVNWLKTSLGGWSNPDVLAFHFRKTLFWMVTCRDPKEYPADGKDCFYGFIRNCDIVADGSGGMTVRNLDPIADTVVINKTNLFKKESLQVDTSAVYGFDGRIARDVYIQMTKHDNATSTQSHDVMINAGPFNNFYIEMSLTHNTLTGDKTWGPKLNAVDPVFSYDPVNGFQIDYDKQILYGTKLPYRMHINYQSPVMLKRGMWSYRRTPNNFGISTRRNGFYTITGGLMSEYEGIDLYPVGSVLTVNGKNTVVKKPVRAVLAEQPNFTELFVRISGSEPELYSTNNNPNGYDLEPNNGAAAAGWLAGTLFWYYDPASWRNSFLPVIDGRRMSPYGYGGTFPMFFGKPGETKPTNRYWNEFVTTQMTWDTSKGRDVPVISTLQVVLSINGSNGYWLSGEQVFRIPDQYTGIVQLEIRHLKTIKWGAGMVELKRIGGEVETLDFRQSDKFTVSAPLTKNIVSFDRMFMGAKADSYPGIENWITTGIRSAVETFKDTPLFNQQLNWVLSECGDMSGMFQNTGAFNKPIDTFNAGNVKLLDRMFMGANAFNQAITFPLDHCISLREMFRESVVFNSSLGGLKLGVNCNATDMFRDAVAFNKTINDWDVANITTMQGFFRGAKAFNQPITLNLPQCKNVMEMFMDNPVFNSAVNLTLPACLAFNRMFQNTTLFNQKLPAWSFIGGTTLDEMFRGAKTYNQSMDHWMMERVVSIRGLLRDAISFNTPVKTWLFYKLRDCAYLFATPSFNSDVNDIRWPTDKTLDIDGGGIFYGATSFNQPLNKWNMVAFGQFNGMFNNARVFNQDISMWNTSNCWRMANLFLRAAAFNGDISKWDVSKVVDFSQFAANAVNFRSDLSKWNVGSCANFNRMFRNALSFNSPVGDWNVSNGTDFESMFDAYDITEASNEPNYAMIFNQDISRWNVSKGIKFNAMFRKCEAFDQDISNWNMGNAEEIGAMFQNCYQFNADLSKWIPGNLINIRYAFYKATKFNRSIDHWDVSRVTDFTQVFLGASAFNQELNSWDVSNGTEFKGMFEDAVKFNGSVGSWNVRKGVNFNRMFWHCFAFNKDISGWRPDAGVNFQDMFRDCYVYNSPMNDWGMANAVTLTDMFTGCLAFNQPLDKWNTAKVTSMQAMFYKTPVFNQDLSTWNTASVLTMANMFKGSGAFNSPLNSWNVGNVIDFTNMFGPINENDPYVFNQPLNNWRPTSATTMTSMFRFCKAFNQKLTGWTTGKVTSMAGMFYYCKAATDLDLNGWDVSKVTAFNDMFSGCTNLATSVYSWNTVSARNMGGMFQGVVKMVSNIANWNVANVTNFSAMFWGCTDFNVNLGTWNVGNALTMSRMFSDCQKFNQNLSAWRPAKCTDFSYMFYNAKVFNQPVEVWTMTAALNLEGMFFYAEAFNQPVNNWRLDKVTNLANVFRGAYVFDQPLDLWNVSNVANFSYSFHSAQRFNRPLTAWDMSGAVNLEGMFRQALLFNSSIANWNISNVTNISWMFYGARVFNQDISNWNTSKVTTMAGTFKLAVEFVGNISSWDTGNVTTMNRMFDGYQDEDDIGRPMKFNGDISNWNVSKVTQFSAMFRFCGLFNQDLQYWKVDNGTDFTSMFEEATAFNANIGSWNVAKATTLGWMFRKAAAFNRDISSWKTGNVTVLRAIFDGALAFNQPLNSWDVSKVTDFSFVFNNAKVFNQELSGWNTISATNMADMFHGASAFNKPIGNWNVANVTAMNGMFTEATAFAQDLSGWNVGKVQDFNSMFRAALNFNSPLNGWDVSSATQMGSMFKGCPKFNQPLNSWNVSKVTNFGYMFDGWEDYPNGSTTWEMIFNQDLSMWNVSAGTTFHYMFRNCSVYNQSMANWNIGNATTTAAMFSGCKELTDPGIGTWDMRKVTLASYMFTNCFKFNSDITPWITSACTNMDSMFENAKLFNRDLSGWNVAKVTTHTNFANGATAWVLPKPNFPS